MLVDADYMSKLKCKIRECQRENAFATGKSNTYKYKFILALKGLGKAKRHF